MSSSMAYPESGGASCRSAATRSFSKKHSLKRKQILTNVLSTTVLFLVLSHLPATSAGIFPYADMELQVNNVGGRGGGSICPRLACVLVAVVRISLCLHSHIPTSVR